MTEAPNGFENVRATITEYVRRAERKQQDVTEHEKCLTNGTYERARESGTEQNYNMIDGSKRKNLSRALFQGRCGQQQKESSMSFRFCTLIRSGLR